MRELIRMRLEHLQKRLMFLMTDAARRRVSDCGMETFLPDVIEWLRLDRAGEADLVGGAELVIATDNCCDYYLETLDDVLWDKQVAQEAARRYPQAAAALAAGLVTVEGGRFVLTDEGKRKMMRRAG